MTSEDARSDQHSDPTTQTEFNLRTENELREHPPDRSSKGRLSESFKRLSDRISIVTRFKRQTTVCPEGQVRKYPFEPLVGHPFKGPFETTHSTILFSKEDSTAENSLLKSHVKYKFNSKTAIFTAFANIILFNFS